MNLKKIRNLAVILALIALSGSIGYDFGRRKIAVSWENNKPYPKIENRFPAESKNIDFSLFWEVWNRIEKSYIDRANIKPQSMVWGAIKGMVASLDDPYTVFLPPEENKRAKEDLAGSFEGIGAQLGMKNKRIVVVAPLKGMPAELAGLKAGDYIIEVDRKDTTNWTLPEAVNHIRGARGTKVVLTIIREGSNGKKDIGIVRDTINVPSIETKLAGAKCGSGIKTGCKLIKAEECRGCSQVAILRLYRFGDKTNGEWEKAVGEILQMQKQAVKNGHKFSGLVFDLRNNPGGYLQGAVYVASEFIKSGVIVKQEMSNGVSEEYKAARKGRLTNIPLVVLVNNGSASASEIVAGAIKNNERAKLVGVKTFGKGSVQEAQELPGGAGLHVTIAKWLLPSGRWIDKNGIEPDVIIENNANDQTRDLQMERAVWELVK